MQNGQYGLGNYCIASAIVQAPFIALYTIGCTTPVYWMTDMNSNPQRFFQFLLAMFMMLFTVESIGQLVGTVVKVL